MVYSYEEFLEDNRSDRTTPVSVIGVSFVKDECICLNGSGEKYSIPIPVLICDMANGMCHINDASKLKKWAHWGEEIDYPDDYFDDPSKYVKMISNSSEEQNEEEEREI